MQTGDVAIKYQSPLPNARHVLPQTNIILRSPARIDPATLVSDLINVTGSISGHHSGELVLSDDGQTIVFKPTVQFAVGETVTVQMAQGPGTKDGRGVAPTRFEFYISQRIAPALDRNSFLELEGIQTETNIPPQSFVADRHRTIVRRDSLPPDFPHIQATVYGTPSPGRIFIADMVLSGSNICYLMILDDLGNPVFYRKTRGDAFDFKVQPNGLLTYGDISSFAYYALDETYAVVDSFRCGNGYRTDVHDLRILPNGHAVLMSYDSQIVDMSQIVAGGDTAAVVIGLIVQELDQNKNVVFQWRSWDYFQITDATHENLTAHQIDYVHGNAVEIDNDGNFILSSRHMDEITKISRQTGEIIWRWGGSHNEFVATNDSIGFSHQHAVRRIDNGHITLFDNGNFHTPQFSRALEYTVDEINKTATVVWQYRNTPDIYGRALGYVQRLPSGNTLIGWGAAVPTMMEVRPDGSKVSELSIVDAGKYSYRAYRFPWTTTSVSGSQTYPAAISLSQNYPNPFNASTTVHVRLAKAANVTLNIFDMLGRNVMTLLDGRRIEPGEYRIKLDADRLSSGVYFCRLDAGTTSLLMKVVLLK